ncbi:MAG: L,D-transpeptidase [Verrucomicrobiales bacterium]|nr:L,D-transpeptidase [Verrucomicrobiales bacterium]
MNFRVPNRFGVTFSASLAALLLTSCAVDEDGNVAFDFGEPSKTSFSSRSGVGPQSKYYSKGHYVFVNESALESLSPRNSKVVIDLRKQRAKIFKTDGGSKDKLVIETQISSGRSEYPTPTGKFRVLEKASQKNSNLYGKWVSPNGTTLIYDGDSREPPKNSPGATFRGSKMPYWVRVTPGGVGMHVGYVPNSPASHGCIRVPVKVQPLIYRNVRVGTPVSIIH